MKGFVPRATTLCEKTELREEEQTLSWTHLFGSILCGLSSEVQTSYSGFMGHQDSQKDVESLQKTDRRRGSCMNIFLITSIFFLFVSVAALAVCGVMTVRKLQSDLLKPYQVSDSGIVESLSGEQPLPGFKMQNFAYIEAVTSTVNNKTMEWAPVTYGEGNSIGSKYIFKSNKNSLNPRQMGTYFIYIEVNLTCTYTSNCSAGVLKLHVGDKLTCNVKLPAHARSVSEKCFTVTQLDTSELLTQMVVPTHGLQNWKLEMTGSGLGMFLVD
ncbi:uncharacterized protein LOC106532342 [Austrofundulus limnaeus]|uniref:Uncharacterized protein LOC106532342 n=1 Tax=Austrofundulus limnaeus TaxID=52670 RepID=A0A2I4CV14_AUSLI|nr:PREDICTED: uncharacterized protein LOC106532342 [Austrofundulus limnaeus]